MCQSCQAYASFLNTKAHTLRQHIQRIEVILPHLISGYEEHLNLRDKFKEELSKIEAAITLRSQAQKVSKMDEFASHAQSSAATPRLARGAPLRYAPSGAACGLA
jgi:hypothetical protein